MSDRGRKSSKSKRKASSGRGKDKGGSPDMASLSYYEILDIAPNADENEIKRGYRKNAIKWHPDKNPNSKEEAEAMFKLVAEAYEVLSDPEKKDIYDRYGKEGLQGGGSRARARSRQDDVDFARAQDMFEAFFGSNPFEDDFFSDNGGFVGFPGPFGMFGAPRRQGHGQGQGQARAVAHARDPFEAMMSGFGAGGFGGGAGTSTSTRTVTTIVNGQRVTKTERTVRYPDGRVETTTDETTGDVAPRLAGFGNPSIDWW